MKITLLLLCVSIGSAMAAVSSEAGNLTPYVENKADGVQQNTTPISGTVTDESGEPVIGASVVVVGTELGAITDLNGSFRLSVP
ncbi:TonB-dependent receptor SusC, partial [termite gut metagenome]